jgi:hypothetical protein
VEPDLGDRLDDAAKEERLTGVPKGSGGLVSEDMGGMARACGGALWDMAARGPAAVGDEGEIELGRGTWKHLQA